MHVVVHGERADRHQNHQHRHHDAADDRLLLAFLLHLLGARLHRCGLSGPTLGAAGTLLRIACCSGPSIFLSTSRCYAGHHTSDALLSIRREFRIALRLRRQLAQVAQIRLFTQCAAAQSQYDRARSGHGHKPADRAERSLRQPAFGKRTAKQRRHRNRQSNIHVSITAYGSCSTTVVSDKPSAATANMISVRTMATPKPFTMCQGSPANRSSQSELFLLAATFAFALELRLRVESDGGQRTGEQQRGCHRRPQ